MQLEETALASIYYDLLDGDGNGAIDEDGITLERDQIWEIISTKHNIDGSNRYIHSIWDAYRVLNESNLPGLKDDFLSGYLNPGFKLTKLDRIFITHGVYADVNGNGIWDPGEDVGFTLKNGVARAENSDEYDISCDYSDENQFNKEVVPGSYIELNVKNGQTGQMVNDYTIHVTETVVGVEEGIPVSYSFEFDTYPDDNGEININMPPAEYSTTMNFTFGGDKKYEMADGFEITSEEFYQELDSAEHSFASYSITLTPKPESGGDISCCCMPGMILLLLGTVVMTNQKN
jgi:hypothetical protein